MNTTQPGGPRRVRISRKATPGEDIRPIGSDVALGQVVLPAGDRLGPAEIGILASVGASRVKVHRRGAPSSRTTQTVFWRSGGDLFDIWPCGVAGCRQPLVAVLSTGDELEEVTVAPGELPYGAIRDSNRATLLAGALSSPQRTIHRLRRRPALLSTATSNPIIRLVTLREFTSAAAFQLVARAL